MLLVRWRQLILGLCCWATVGVLFSGMAVAASSGPADPEAAVTLLELIENALRANQEFLSATAEEQRFNARIPLIENLDEELLAFYYLDFPVGNMSRGTSERINQARAEGERNVTAAGARGQILTGRDMVENQALWYQYLKEDTRLQLIRKLKQEYFRLYFHDRIIAVTEQNLATLDGLVRVSQARYAVGKLPQKAVLAIQLERSLLYARLLELRQKRVELEVGINYLAGRSVQNPVVAVQDQELTHERLPALELNAGNLAARLYQQRPLLKGYQALGARFRAMKMMVMKFFNRDVRTEAMFEADSGLRAIRAKGTDVYNQVTADLATTTADLEKNLELARLYGGVILPQARQGYQASLADFEVGSEDSRATLQALLALNRYQVEYYQTLANYMVDLAKLEGLSGQSLFGPELPNDNPNHG